MVSPVYSIHDLIGIWRQRSSSTLAQVMDCSLMAQFHYLKQCWHIIKVGLWHSPGSHLHAFNTNWIRIMRSDFMISNYFHIFQGQWSSLKPESAGINLMTWQPCWWPCSYRHQGQFPTYDCACMMPSSYGNISALLALGKGNQPVTGWFSSQRPVTLSFDVFLDLRVNKHLRKQSRLQWFETPSRSLWRLCNEKKTFHV